MLDHFLAFWKLNRFKSQNVNDLVTLFVLIRVILVEFNINNQISSSFEEHTLIFESTFPYHQVG